jgi:hypothetical protein
MVTDKGVRTDIGHYYDYFGPGIIVAVIYLLLGLPFVRFARTRREGWLRSKKMENTVTGKISTVHRHAIYNDAAE